MDNDYTIYDDDMVMNELEALRNDAYLDARDDAIKSHMETIRESIDELRRIGNLANCPTLIAIYLEEVVEYAQEYSESS